MTRSCRGSGVLCKRFEKGPDRVSGLHLCLPIARSLFAFLQIRGLSGPALQFRTSYRFQVSIAPRTEMLTRPPWAILRPLRRSTKDLAPWFEGVQALSAVFETPEEKNLVEAITEALSNGHLTAFVVEPIVGVAFEIRPEAWRGSEFLDHELAIRFGIFSIFAERVPPQALETLLINRPLCLLKRGLNVLLKLRETSAAELGRTAQRIITDHAQLTSAPMVKDDFVARLRACHTIISDRRARREWQQNAPAEWKLGGPKRRGPAK